MHDKERMVLSTHQSQRHIVSQTFSTTLSIYVFLGAPIEDVTLYVRDSR